MPVDMQATLDEIGLGNVFEDITEEMIYMLMHLVNELLQQFNEDENLAYYDAPQTFEQALKDFKRDFSPLVDRLYNAALSKPEREMMLLTIERMRPDPEPEPEPESRKKDGNSGVSRGRKNRNDKGLSM